MKKIMSLAITVAMATACQAQSLTAVTQGSSHGWQLKDEQADGYFGISLDKAYAFVHAKHRKPKTIVVAVIDSGVDTTHEDLKSVLWHNPGEIPGNGIDDDHNGYVDDVYGWNFLGGRDGRNVFHDSFEADRVYYQYKDQFATITDSSALSANDQYLFTMWKRAEKTMMTAVDTLQLAGLEKAYARA